jgi:hypothetical protein
VKRALAVLFALFAVALGALLIAGCRPRGPLTAPYVPHLLSCEPEAKDRTCMACVRAACCAELQACGWKTGCACALTLHTSGTEEAKVRDFCGRGSPLDATYDAVIACVEPKCPMCRKHEEVVNETEDLDRLSLR